MNFPSFSTYEVMTLELVIWSLFVGIVIGVGAIIYSKRILGALVRELLKVEATSPDAAKSFADLGFKHTFLFKFSLRKKSTFRKMVNVTTAENGGENKFFIPTEKVYRANYIYNGKDASLLVGLLAVLSFLIMVMLCFWIAPEIGNMTADFIGNLFGTNK